MKHVADNTTQNQPSLVASNINRNGDITNPPPFTITTTNLITVLPISNATKLPIAGMLEKRQHPKEQTRRTCRWQLRLQTYPLSFAR